ncbi:hypothetical protein HCN51_48710 [Nonomuraea sp. FMUSA5-5]|uniref:Uncharacterized protein n=1 Tax=Nonomuraea composti TaxID=2720023 RepID=A0ABX1BHK2_9ACTN|nr:hypothetical protein [Nonomuraea sp. FMUSA5-5]NJP97224.1 hypothetical protein [Nonomuraea sp. FMUSA5-5]
MRLLPPWFRELRHHPAFRVPPPEWAEPVQEQLAALLAALDPPQKATPDGSGAPDGSGTPDENAAQGGSERMPATAADNDKALATAATNLWRAERKLATRGKDATSRQAGRYLRTTRQALAEAGLVVQDHDGEAFHSGRSIEVLLFQDDPSLTEETVLETVRPSIYLRDRHIQMGQVIVGCPPRDHVRNEHA